MFLILGTLFLPKYGVLAAFIVAVSRFAYAVTYITKGPDLGRAVGVLGNIAVYGLGVGAFVVSLQ